MNTKENTKEKSPTAALQAALKEAKNADSYMVALWHVRDGQVHLFRQTRRFPLGDMPVAMELLEKNLGLADG